jgi:arylsulfatase A-like enzyme
MTSRLALLLASVLVTARLADAQCTTATDAKTVSASIRKAVACDYTRLRRGPTATCHTTPPPACAGTLVADAVALAYGANDPPAAAVDHVASKATLACQKAIGTGVATFVGKKLTYLVKGLDPATAEARARRTLDKLPKKCALAVAQDPGGVVLPDVGPQCDAAVGAPGTAVDPTALAGALVTLLETWVDRVGPHAAPPRPNIVLILADDQRFDTIGLAHSLDGVTPVMKNVTAQIVGHGVTFQNSYTTTALCAPSRSSLLAAKYSHTTGVHDNSAADGGFSHFHDSSTIATWLHAAGYKTGLFGKYLNGYGPASPYTPPGWDEWHAFKAPEYFNYTLAENGVEVVYGSTDSEYSTDVLAAKVVQFIHDNAGTTPFFAYFAPYSPHAPATPAPRYVGSFSSIPPWRPPNFNEADVSDKPAWLRAITLWGPTKIANQDAFDRKQLECLQATDDAVGAVMQALRDTGVDGNTIVIYAADNGYSWGSHRWEPKQCPYEECTRVPLVVAYPPLTPLPRVETRFGLNIDYAETLAELAGAVPDAGVEGASLVRVVDGTAPTWRTDFLEEHWHGQITTYAQVHGVPWKYTEYTTAETELYDEGADPFELGSVAPANPTVVAAMAARLRQLRPLWPLDSPSGAFVE